MTEIVTMPYYQDANLIPQDMLDNKGLRRILFTPPHKEEQPSNSTGIADTTQPQSRPGSKQRGITGAAVLPEEAWRLHSATTQRFITSKKWEGVVNKIDTDSGIFFAQLNELNAENIIEEDAELPINDVAEDDLELFKEGAIFFFSVGYRISEAGTHERSSRIRFQRLPKWKEDDIIDAHNKAKEIISKIKLE